MGQSQNLSKDPRTTVDYTQNVEDFDAKLPMLPQDYYFHFPVPGAVTEDPMKGCTGLLDPDQRCPRLSEDAVELVVIPYAIHKPPRFCSRATSCYAVVRLAVAFPEDIDCDAFWLDTLKLSWQHPDRLHELTWYVRLQGEDKVRTWRAGFATPRARWEAAHSPH